jgi:hypothetical protein
MANKLGAKKKERELTIKDLESHPIWIEPAGDFGSLRSLKIKDVNVTKKLVEDYGEPRILCTVREVRKLFAYGWCSIKDSNLARPRFWQAGKWIDVKELKARLPLTLVAVPKVEGETDVEYYLLTRHDQYAARIGGVLFRNSGPHKFKELKLSRDILPKEAKSKTERRGPKRSAKKTAPMRLARAKLGPLTPATKITLKHRVKHPVWVSTYEEDDGDEDAQRAVISADPNVSSDVIRKFLGATVTFKVNGAKAYGIGSYDRDDDNLTDLQFWTGKQWAAAGRFGAKFPVILEPLCRILGKRNVQFILKKSGDRKAVRTSAV